MDAIYGCAGCATTAGAGGCPVHGQRVNMAPVPDWNKMHPNINEKYSGLLQSHHSICSEMEILKEELRKKDLQVEAARKCLKQIAESEDTTRMTAEQTLMGYNAHKDLARAALNEMQYPEKRVEPQQKNNWCSNCGAEFALTPGEPPHSFRSCTFCS